MNVEFVSTVPAGTQIVARIVNQGVLPDGLEALSALIPLRYAFDGARQALFAGTGWEGDVLALVAFAVVLWPLSVLLFGRAGAWARRAGSLSEY